jgi:hypothetical protein
MERAALLQVPSPPAFLRRVVIGPVVGPNNGTSDPDGFTRNSARSRKFQQCHSRGVTQYQHSARRLLMSFHGCADTVLQRSPIRFKSERSFELLRGFFGFPDRRVTHPKMVGNRCKFWRLSLGRLKG